MNDARIITLTTTLALPAYRATQLREAFFRQHVPDFAGVTTWPKALREQAATLGPAMSARPVVVLRARDGLAVKALLELADGKRIETVLLCPKPGLWSCCISSQVGCALGCKFCATGRLGFTRHLTSEEITDQVLYWRQYLHQHLPGETLQNIVYMGMGEPLHNDKEVFASLDELMNPVTFGIGARHLSVSTSGLVPGILAMADRYPQVNLALSLHAANDALRLSLMPVNKKYPLAKLAEAIHYYFSKANRKLFIEYILIAGRNDQPVHAAELADYLRQFGKGHLLHVNLIPCNPTDNELPGSAKDAARAFRQQLLDLGVPATIRKTLGRELDGACGQLALKVPAGTPAPAPVSP
jgi:23S rRNA (adenine(2503)-C(2))-methyltransferase